MQINHTGTTELVQLALMVKVGMATVVKLARQEHIQATAFVQLVLVAKHLQQVLTQKAAIEE